MSWEVGPELDYGSKARTGNWEWSEGTPPGHGPERLRVEDVDILPPGHQERPVEQRSHVLDYLSTRREVSGLTVVGAPSRRQSN